MLELSAVKPWSVRIARESGCKITDCVFSAKRGLIRGNGKVGKDIVTLNEKKREVTFVKEGDVVESVTVILRTKYCYKIYTRNPREEIRIKFWLCCVVVKYTTPAMVKLVNEIVAPTSGVVNHDTVSHQMTSNCDKLWKAVLSFLSRPVDYGMHIKYVFLQEKAGYMMRTMYLVRTNKVTTVNVRCCKTVKRNTFPIREDWSGRFRKEGFASR